MTDTVVESEPAEEPVREPSSTATEEQLIAMLVDRARTDGMQLTGEGGLLQMLTKRVLESALESEIFVGFDPFVVLADADLGSVPKMVSRRVV